MPINRPILGESLASDDIAGASHQLVKIEHGDTGVATPVSALAPLPVDPAGLSAPVELLASGARTASVNSAVFENLRAARGVILLLDVTVASGTGGLSLGLFAHNPSGSVLMTYLAHQVAGTAYVATGLYGFEVGSGATGAVPTIGTARVRERVAAGLTRRLAARVIHADASSYTYALYYAFTA